MTEPAENETHRIDLRNAPTDFLRLDIAARTKELALSLEQLQALRDELARLEQHVSNLTEHTGHMEAVVRWRERTGHTDGDVFTEFDAFFERYGESPDDWIAEEIERGAFPISEQGVERRVECLFVVVCDTQGQRFRLGFELAGLCYANDGKSLDCGEGCAISHFGPAEGDAYTLDFDQDVFGEPLTISIESACPILFEQLPPTEAATAQ